MISFLYPASDGAELSACLWSPTSLREAAGLVVALHGMGGAASEMAPLGEYLSARGWVVAAPNLRSNGLDPVVSRRGHFFNVEVWRADAECFWKHMQSGLPAGTPVFLFGESMGALLAVCFTASGRFGVPLGGMVLAAPVFELRQKTPALVRGILRGLAAVFPRLVIPPSVFVHGKAEPPRLTRDPVYQEYTLTAPHRINSYTISFTAGMDCLMRAAKAAAPQTTIPFLLLGGEEDVFTSPAHLEAWFEAASSADKTLRIFPGTHHILLHELNTLEILETIHSWLEERVNQRGKSPLVNASPEAE